MREVVCRSVSRAQRRQAKAALDGCHDGSCVVLRVVNNEIAAQKRRHDQCWNSSSWAPLIVGSGGAALAGRRDVVPLATKLVVGDDDHRVFRALAALDRSQQRDKVIASATLACI